MRASTLELCSPPSLALLRTHLRPRAHTQISGGGRGTQGVPAQPVLRRSGRIPGALLGPRPLTRMPPLPRSLSNAFHPAHWLKPPPLRVSFPEFHLSLPRLIPDDSVACLRRLGTFSRELCALPLGRRPRATLANFSWIGREKAWLSRKRRSRGRRDRLVGASATVAVCVRGTRWGGACYSRPGLPRNCSTAIDTTGAYRQIGCVFCVHVA